jgi:hypothetical protein
MIFATDIFDSGSVVTIFLLNIEFKLWVEQQKWSGKFFNLGMDWEMMLVDVTILNCIFCDRENGSYDRTDDKVANWVRWPHVKWLTMIISTKFVWLRCFWKEIIVRGSTCDRGLWFGVDELNLWKSSRMIDRHYQTIERYPLLEKLRYTIVYPL